MVVASAVNLVALAEIFWPRVQKGPGCWLWTGPVDKDGYGVCHIPLLVGGRGPTRRAHRAAFLLDHGRWPSPCGLHACDTPACVRVDPKHVGEGTHAKNIADRDARGHGPAGERNGRAKLTVELVAAIRTDLAGGAGLCATSRKYGLHNRTVADIRDRRIWRDVA